MSPFSFVLGRLNLRDAREGQTAERDILAEEDIVFQDMQATALKREAEVHLVPPVFSVDEEVSERVFSRFEVFSDLIIRYGGDEAAAERLFLQLQAGLPGEFTGDAVRFITSYPDLPGLMTAAESTLHYLLNYGVIRKSTLEKVSTPGSVEIRRLRDGRSERNVLAVTDVLTLGNISDHAETYFKQAGFDSSLLPYVSEIVRGLIAVNTFYDKEQTVINRQKVSREISPVMKKIESGDFVLREGETITRADIEKIIALENYSRKVNLYSVLATLIFLGLLYALGIFFLRPPLSSSRLNNSQVGIFLASLLLFLVITLIVDRFTQSDDWMPLAVFLPTVFFSILISMLINPRASIVFTIIASLTVLVETGLDPASFMFCLFSGITAVLLTKNTEKRIDLLRGIFIHSLLSGVIMLMIAFQKQLQIHLFPRLFGIGVLNGFANGMLHLGVLPLLEHILNVPTRFRLIELADTNSPLLKKMLTMAPGTYSHSLNVANLAEAASKEIGANWLLARVGAFYHDIGKIEQPEYFVENQREVNKLNELNPSLSVAVIKSHVKIGIEKAKELRLPKAVIDIISQHHGSGLISYFYNEALKDDKKSTILKQDYSYTEAVPESKEAAVVMLADTVDAAVRTLKKPSIAKLEKFIWDLFLFKIREKQFNNCDLTMKNLETIKKIFVHILSGYFHGRIEYPQVNGEKIE